MTMKEVSKTVIGKKLASDGVVFTEESLKGILKGYTFSNEELKEFYSVLLSDSSLPIIKAFNKLEFVKICRIEYIRDEHLAEAFTMTEDEFWSSNQDWPEQMCNDAEGYQKMVREFHRFVSKNFPQPVFV